MFGPCADADGDRLLKPSILRVSHVKWMLTFPTVEAEVQYLVRSLETEEVPCVKKPAVA